jgi:DNA replication protein DnaC
MINGEQVRLKPITIDGKCPTCGDACKVHYLDFGDGKRHMQCGLCKPCGEAEEREAKLRMEQDRHDENKKRLNAIMPKIFRRTTRDRLPYPQLLDTALRWQWGAMGLLFVGQTGSGKSRVAWEVVKRECLAGRRFAAIDETFGTTVSKHLFQNILAYEQWLIKLCHVPLLLIDDVTHCTMTDRVEEALFRIVDERTKQERPIIMTTNETGETLAAKIGGTKGEPLARRLREFCETITSDGMENTQCPTRPETLRH